VISKVRKVIVFENFENSLQPSLQGKLYNRNMTSKAIISRIRKHHTQLVNLGVKSLSLFGSVARDEERSDSDIDILVEFEGRATFDRFMDTKFYLEEILGRKVDLVTPEAIKPRMAPYIMRDLIHVT
jgi:predicted nucleotidyltransferase